MQAGSLTEVNGVWQLRGDAVVPSGLDTLIGDRLEHVDDTVFSALKVLSMCEPLDIDTLCEIASDEAVDAAEIADLIRVERDGVRTVVRFSHPMFGKRCAAGWAPRRDAGYAASWCGCCATGTSVLPRTASGWRGSRLTATNPSTSICW